MGREAGKRMAASDRPGQLDRKAKSFRPFLHETYGTSSEELPLLLVVME